MLVLTRSKARARQPFFLKNAKLLSNYNKFGVLQNSDLIIQSLNNN